MKVAELNFDEELRLETLSKYKLLRSPREKEFDDLVELVSIITGCPYVAITFMGKDLQWVKAEKNIGVRSVKRRDSICNLVFDEARDENIVEDMSEDSRFAAHPMVNSGFCFRFYCSRKILTENGIPLGTICAFDTKPNSLTGAQQKSMEIIASQVTLLLEARLKRLQLHERASELIRLEQETVKRALLVQEEHKQEVGYRLHEDFAQTLAACHAFLSVAETDEQHRPALIRQTREQLHKLIGDLRGFSRRITPSLLNEVDMAELLQGLVSEYSKGQTFIRLDVRGHSIIHNSELALTLFRNVQDYLAEIREAKVSQVTVRLRIGDDTTLLLMDNRPPRDAGVLEKDTIVRTIFNRSRILGGEIRYKHFSEMGNALLLHFPLSA